MFQLSIWAFFPCETSKRVPQLASEAPEFQWQGPKDRWRWVEPPWWCWAVMLSCDVNFEVSQHHFRWSWDQWNSFLRLQFRFQSPNTIRFQSQKMGSELWMSSWCLQYSELPYKYWMVTPTDSCRVRFHRWVGHRFQSISLLGKLPRLYNQSRLFWQ